MSEQSVVYKSKTVLLEISILVGLSFFTISVLTVFDISIHDFYVKPIIAECHPENTNVFCEELRELHGCDPSDQLCLGAIYWAMIGFFGTFIGVLVALVRTMFAVLLKQYVHKKITGATILMIITYFIIGSGMFYFGFLDTLYYVFQGDNVPEELSWLNNSGIFSESKKWFGDPNVVEIDDLLATNVIGLMVIGLSGMATMLLYSNLKKSPNGIA